MPKIKVMATRTAFPQRLVSAGEIIEVDEDKLPDYVGDEIDPRDGKVIGRKPFELVDKGQAFITAEKQQHEQFMSTAGMVKPAHLKNQDVPPERPMYDPEADKPRAIEPEPVKNKGGRPKKEK